MLLVYELTYDEVRMAASFTSNGISNLMQALRRFLLMWL